MAKRTIKKKDGSGLTLEQAFTEFRQEKETLNLSEATIRNYVQSYNMFVMFTGISSPHEITISHIYQFIEKMKKSNITPASINHYLRDCRAFLYWCMDEEKGYIKPFKIKLLAAQEEQPKLFTDDELMKLLEKPNNTDCFSTWRTWVIVNWVLGTGNRCSTICEVRIGDINFTSKEITMRHTKNKRSQIIPLSPTLETILKEYIRTWRYDADADSWLFPNICDEQLTANALKHSFAKFCHDRGVDRTSIHGLRHNFAKGWVKNNGNMFVLQKILGHSTLDMTRRYVRLFSDDLKEDYDRYSPLDTIKRAGKREHKVKRR